MIEFITGVMGSGKSAELLERIEKFKGRYLVIKPTQDTRDGAFVKSRNGKQHPAILVDDSNEMLRGLILEAVEKYDAVFVDEVQFFSWEFISKLSDFCETYNTRLICSGLTYDFKGNYFPSSGFLDHYADGYEFYHSEKCYHCDDNGDVDVLMDADDNILFVGESVQPEGKTDNHYETLCSMCYNSRKHYYQNKKGDSK
jgi:thymidine kinase